MPAPDVTLIGTPPVTPLQRAEELKEQGNAAFMANDLMGAKRSYGEAILAYPVMDAVYSNRAAVHLKEAAWGDLVRDCTTVLELDPPSDRKFKAHLRRAHGRLQLGDVAGAQTDLRVCYIKSKKCPDLPHAISSHVVHDHSATFYFGTLGQKSSF
jgi:hypothetical protein